MPNLFSYPSTLAAAQAAKTCQIKVLADNVHLNLDSAPRAFNTGDIVNLSDHEYAGIAAAAFTSDFLLDRGSVRTIADDNHVKIIEIPVILADIADGTIGGFQTDFAGAIREVRFLTLDPATTSAKSSTLTLKVGTKPIGTNEKVTLTAGGSGLTSFTLTFGGQTTTSLDAAATAAEVQAALEALSTIGADNVLVTGSAGGPYTVTFIGTLGGADVGGITTTPTGGTGTMTPAVATAGNATTLALTTAACDTEGEVLASTGTLTQADNAFASGTEISVVASSTTAFVEGRGVLQIFCIAS